LEWKPIIEDWAIPREFKKAPFQGGHYAFSGGVWLCWHGIRMNFLLRNEIMVDILACQPVHKRKF
jgi:hypothetical protein